MMFRSVSGPLAAAFVLSTLAVAQANVPAWSLHRTLGPSNWATPAPAPTGPPPGVSCTSTAVAMRDNTLLATDVYLPVKSGRYPVIVERSPYAGPADHGCFAAGFELPLSQFAEHGYAVVFQEVRGTSISGGTFDPFTQEIHDEYDTIEWAAKQKWSTGRVGTTGVSYLGIDQWMGAIATPPHLYAINPNVAGSNFYDSPVYEQGVVRWSDGLGYAPDFVPDSIFRTGVANGTPLATIEQEIGAFETSLAANIGNYTETLPLSAMTAYEPYPEAHFFYNWSDHPTYDSFWLSQDVEEHWPQITVPALIGGASIDLFNIGAIRNYQGLRRFAGSAAARTGTKLYWQAYGHAGDSGTPTFGNDSTPWAANLADEEPAGEQLAFFDHYLKGVANGYEKTPNAMIYVLVPPNSGETGSGFWLGADDFPLRGTRTLTLALGSRGHANSRNGDGFLALQSFGPRHHPVSAQSDSFTYDPNNPVPTVGGNLLSPDTLTHKTGFQDQSTVELRNDVLVFTSDALPVDVPVIGTVNASFWAATSARDTDFTVKLVDVHPDGLTHNVMDRVVAARYRLGDRLPPNFVTPNRPYLYRMEVGNTATIFRKGHKIRVEISSSNFPKFARNLNTAQPFYAQNTIVVAHQTLFHDWAHQSVIELPVAPRVKAP